MVTSPTPRGLWLGVLVVVVLGLWLRSHQWLDQVLADDEWHGLSTIQSYSVPQLFTMLGESDHCIPTTIYKRLLWKLGWVTEATVRLPALLAGIGLLLVPWWLRRRGALLAAFTLGLLAVAPLQVYFTRYGRPYSIAALLSVVAILALLTWYRRGGRAMAILYVLSAGLVPWFHMTVAPFVLAPVLPLWIHAICQKQSDRRRRPLRLVALAAGAGLLIAITLGPALWCDLQSLTGKAGKANATWSTITEMLALQAGSAHWPVVVGFVLATGFGAGLWARRDPLATMVVITAMVTQLVAVLLAKPAGIHDPIVLTRYLIPWHAFLLMAVAASLASLCQRIPGAALTVPVLAGTLLWTGPMPHYAFSPNAWTNHGLLQYGVEIERTRVRHYQALRAPDELHGFYAQMAALPAGTVCIAEAPNHYEWARSPYVVLQLRHRQRVLAGIVNDLVPGHRSPNFDCAGEGGWSRNEVKLSDFEALRQRGVDYLVLHRDLAKEFHGLAAGAALDLTAVVERYRAYCGAPHYEDQFITVFRMP